MVEWGGGLKMDSLTLDDAVANVGRRIGGALRGYVVTPNADHVVRYYRDPAFRAACQDAALRLPDGMPVVWASRLLGKPLKARVAGSDLLPALCRHAASAGYTVFLLGGRTGVAQAAAARLGERHPGLRVVGTHTPPGGFEITGPAADAAVRAVNTARPDLLFVGLGSPKQELWVHQHWQELSATVAVCCGAAIDYAAGAQRRAPAWMQRIGMEWLWRLAREPRRLWRRYLVEDTAFLGIFLREWWRLRVRKSRG